MQGGPGSVGEARDMEALADEDEVSMECSEVQEEDSDSYGKMSVMKYYVEYNKVL